MTSFSSPPGTVKTGGVRFSEEPPPTTTTTAAAVTTAAAATAAAASATAASHVHFEEKLHDSVVMVTPEANGNFLVKVRIINVIAEPHRTLPGLSSSFITFPHLYVVVTFYNWYRVLLFVFQLVIR